jgi:hypothetical protein
MSVVFLRESPSFAREEIVDMAHAVDDICKALEISPDDAQTMKAIAARVVEHAKRGERNPEVLAERVVSEMRAEQKADSPETAPSA